MIVVVAQPGLLSKAMDEVYGVLRQERRVKYGEPDSFSLSTAEQMIEDFRQVTAVTALVMVVRSSLCLLVGGIGVMNIMLVSVTERTREIGIRKAIGARRNSILLQFLLEAMTMSGIGGMIGVLIGAGFALLVRMAFPALPASVSTFWVTMALLISASIGITFGIYPAWKAARLDPVEALRYE